MDTKILSLGYKYNKIKIWFWMQCMARTSNNRVYRSIPGFTRVTIRTSYLSHPEDQKIFPGSLKLKFHSGSRDGDFGSLLEISWYKFFDMIFVRIDIRCFLKFLRMEISDQSGGILSPGPNLRKTEVVGTIRGNLSLQRLKWVYMGFKGPVKIYRVPRPGFGKKLP